MGSAPFNLAKYARDPETTEKLFVNGQKDMYIEISVLSKPMDSNSVMPSKPMNPPNASSTIASKRPNENRRKEQKEPVSEEDFKLVNEYKEREKVLLEEIS